MTYHELVKKLVGKISPIGESNTDAERFENLKEMCHLAEMILMDIHDMKYNNRGNNQSSVKKCVDYADNFFAANVKELVG